VKVSPADFWLNKREWDGYWETLNEPYRDALIAALAKLPAFTSLLEIGCGPGVNLWRVLEAFPDVTVGGFDVSHAAIANGHARFQKAEQENALSGKGDIWLAVGALPDSLHEVQPVDVVLSCYALAYVPPHLIRPTLEQMATVAQQAMVLAEPMTIPGFPGGQIHNPPEWRYDYLRWFQTQPNWQVTSMKVCLKDRMNRILVAERKA